MTNIENYKEARKNREEINLLCQHCKKPTHIKCAVYCVNCGTKLNYKEKQATVNNSSAKEIAETIQREIVRKLYRK